jgi:hypothetical protein
MQGISRVGTFESTCSSLVKISSLLLHWNQSVFSLWTASEIEKTLFSSASEITTSVNLSVVYLNMKKKQSTLLVIGVSKAHTSPWCVFIHHALIRPHHYVVRSCLSIMIVVSHALILYWLNMVYCSGAHHNLFWAEARPIPYKWSLLLCSICCMLPVCFLTLCVCVYDSIANWV